MGSALLPLQKAPPPSASPVKPPPPPPAVVEPPPAEAAAESVAIEDEAPPPEPAVEEAPPAAAAPEEPAPEQQPEAPPEEADADQLPPHRDAIPSMLSDELTAAIGSAGDLDVALSGEAILDGAGEYGAAEAAGAPSAAEDCGAVTPVSSVRSRSGSVLSAEEGGTPAATGASSTSPPSSAVTSVSGGARLRRARPAPVNGPSSASVAAAAAREAREAELAALSASGGDKFNSVLATLRQRSEQDGAVTGSDVVAVAEVLNAGVLHRPPTLLVSPRDGAGAGGSTSSLSPGAAPSGSGSDSPSLPPPAPHHTRGVAVKTRYWGDLDPLAAPGAASAEITQVRARTMGTIAGNGRVTSSVLLTRRPPLLHSLAVLPAQEPLKPAHETMAAMESKWGGTVNNSGSASVRAGGIVLFHTAGDRSAHTHPPLTPHRSPLLPACAHPPSPLQRSRGGAGEQHGAGAGSSKSSRAGSKDSSPAPTTPRQGGARTGHQHQQQQQSHAAVR